jgi:hypothetical protein
LRKRQGRAETNVLYIGRRDSSTSTTWPAAGRGSGIYVEDQVGIVYELRDGLATRISGHRDVVEAFADAELDV